MPLKTHHAARRGKPGFQQSQRLPLAATGSQRTSSANLTLPPRHTGTVACWLPLHRPNPEKSSVPSPESSVPTPPCRGTLVGTLPPRNECRAQGTDVCARLSGCQARTLSLASLQCAAGLNAAVGPNRLQYPGPYPSPDPGSRRPAPIPGHSFPGLLLYPHGLWRGTEAQPHHHRRGLLQPVHAAPINRVA